MNKRNTTILGLLAVITIVMGGVGFAVAQETPIVDEILCDGTGPQGMLSGRGFWSQLTEEQSAILLEQTQEMIDAGASHDEIRDMKASLLEEWGIKAPLWGGPHYGERAGGYGRQLRDGSGGSQGRRGNGGKGRGNGACSYTG